MVYNEAKPFAIPNSEISIINTRCTLTIGLFLTVLLSLFLACGGDDGPTGKDDTTPPSITGTSPADGAISFPVTGTVSVTFSESVASASITTSSFTLTPAGGSAVAATFSSTGQTIFLRPTAELAYETIYTARVTTTVTDLSGNHLASEYTWTFTTEDDPNGLPATITGTVPDSSATDVAVDIVISATFSKGMNPATLTNSTVQLRDSLDALVSAAVAYTGATRTVTVTPNDSLDYNAHYYVTIDGAVADTFGIQIGYPSYVWGFFTEQDPESPTITMTWPPDNAILDDTVTLQATVNAFATVDSVIYYRGSTSLGTVTVPPYSLSWSVSGMAIGQPYAIYARVYDSQGRSGASQVLTAYYQWELMWFDANDPWPTDIRRIYARTTNDDLTLRIETSEPWNTYPYPKDTTIGGDPFVLLDTSFAFAIYLDTDRNPLTGRLDGGGATLNGIGADHRILVGFFGGDTTLSYWDPPPDSVWALIYDTTGLAYHDVPPDSNVFIIGVAWADMSNANGADIVVLNADLDLDDPNSFVTDFAPNQGAGFISIERGARWLGDGYTKSGVASTSGRSAAKAVPATRVVNPFR
ncbi:Ig-like domain-containing protein [bacterium]|nr:Ig-like domain-containing protein [bacterium]